MTFDHSRRFLPLCYFVATQNGFFLYERHMTAQGEKWYGTYVQGNHWDEDIISFRRPGGQMCMMPVGPSVEVLTKEEFYRVQSR